jgi:chemotaxis protein MotB
MTSFYNRYSSMSTDADSSASMGIEVENFNESPIFIFTDLLIGVVFLLLIVISTLSLTYRSEIKEGERVVNSENSLLKNLLEIQNNLKTSHYEKQQLAKDLDNIEKQTIKLQEKNINFKLEIKALGQQQLVEKNNYQQKLNQQKQKQVVLQEKLETVKNTRLVPQQLLSELTQQFKQNNIPVTIDSENGIIHFADSLLFASSSSALTHKGKEILQQLAKIFINVLPCYSQSDTITKKRLKCTQQGQKQIEAIFIEGHTDNIPFASTSYDNWLLSMSRARETYKQLILVSPQLNTLKNRTSQPLFSLSAYGETRPIASNENKQGRAKNRRIDIRLISFGYTLDRLSKQHAN